MALTTAQLATLKAAILAETDPAFVAARTNGQTPLMTAWFNAEKAPAVKVWRKDVPPQDSDEATPWVNFDNITQAGKRDAWVHAFMRYPRDYSKASIRKWITDVWGNNSDSAAILTNAGLRNATRAEALLGGTNVTTTNGVSGIKLDWSEPMTDAYIGLALES